MVRSWVQDPLGACTTYQSKINKYMYVCVYIIREKERGNSPKGVIKNKRKHASAIIIGISPYLAIQIRKKIMTKKKKLIQKPGGSK